MQSGEKNALFLEQWVLLALVKYGDMFYLHLQLSI